MPLATTATVAAGITVANGTFTLVQTAYKLAAVDEDLQLCLGLLADAEKDLNHARRQISNCKSGKTEVSFSTTDLDYFQSAIEMMALATLNLGKLVQRYRVQQDVDDGISLPNRFRWVLQGKDKFASHQNAFTTAHNRLMAVIVRLGTAQPAASPIYVPPPPYRPTSDRLSVPTDSPKILRSPSQLQALRGKRPRILTEEIVRPESSSSASSSVGYGQSNTSVSEDLEFGYYN